MFPLNYYVYRRDTGQLNVWNRPNGKAKFTLEARDIHYVRVSINKDKQNENCPDDYSYLFLLQTAAKCFYLYAATSEERDIWIHDFANFCAVRKETPVNSVRDEVADKIDLSESLEAKGLVRQAIKSMEQSPDLDSSDKSSSYIGTSALNTLD